MRCVVSRCVVLVTAGHTARAFHHTTRPPPPFLPSPSLCSFSKALTEQQAPARDEEACVEALAGCVRADRRSASGAVGWDEDAPLLVVACAEAPLAAMCG